MPTCEISADAAPARISPRSLDSDLPRLLSQHQLLAQRRTSSLPAGSGKNKTPLLWGVGDLCSETALESRELITRLARAETARQSLWLRQNLTSLPESIDEASNPVAALVLVGWARNLGALAEATDEHQWQTATRRLANIIQQARGEADTRPSSIGPDCLTRQLLCVELSLTLCRWLTGKSPVAERARCVSLLEESLLAEVDDDGLVRELPRQHWLALLACWTRCRMLAQSAGMTVRPDAGDRYQDFVESLFRLASGKGTLAWPGQEPRMPSTVSPAKHQELELWRAAATLVQPQLRRAMGLVWPKTITDLPATARQRASRRATAVGLPSPSGRCEQAGLAVLRPAWTAPRLIIDYAGPRFRLRLDRNDDIWIDGDCALHLTIDGRQLEPQSLWEEICWITDDDVDYLELQLDLDGDVRVQRHVLFAREDEFLFLADAVLGTQPADICYESSLPVHAGLSLEAAAETREVAFVKAGRRRGLALPLALDEWRAQRGRGEFTAEPDGLRLTQTARQATSLFAPCFMDVSASRSRRPVTWRRLTVAEERQTQADDEAVGYRVRIGQQQWLFYRSLAACGNRTLLGHNLVSEFLAARFSRKGIPETLIEIEPPADEDE